MKNIGERIEQLKEEINAQSEVLKKIIVKDVSHERESGSQVNHEEELANILKNGSED